MKKLLLIVFCSFLATATMAQIEAVKDIQTPEPEIGIVEHLDEYIPESISIINTGNQQVNLRELINKPTVLMLVYYRCPGICSPLMTSVAELISKVDLEPGKDYQILTISFDPREGNALAVAKQVNYMNLVEKEIDPSGWQFFTADSANIAALTKAVGFKYKRTGNDFMHPGVLTMVSPQGKITRYLQGTYFLPFEFKMAIVETSKGISGPTIFKVLQFCYSYDPAGQEYVLNVTKMAGTLILGIGIIVFLVLVFKPKRKVTSYK